MTRTARAAGYYMTQLGWALIEIPPGGKRPLRKGWQHAPLPEEYWTRRPHHGIGLLHQYSGTATVDADASLEHVTAALAAAGVDYAALLAAAGPHLIGNPERPRKLLYRVPDGLELRRRPLRWPPRDPASREYIGIFELRAAGGQDVLPPTIHPDTHQPYCWAGSGCPRSPDDIPYLPMELALLWLNWDKREHAMRAACPWAPPPPPRPARGDRPASDRQHSGIRAHYCGAVSVIDVLERNGYRHAQGNRWISPGSKSGTPGVELLADGRVYSYHASDPLDDRRAHDAFSAMCVLEHAGDFHAALTAARQTLGLED